MRNKFYKSIEEVLVDDKLIRMRAQTIVMRIINNNELIDYADVLNDTYVALINLFQKHPNKSINIYYIDRMLTNNSLIFLKKNSKMSPLSENQLSNESQEIDEIDDFDEKPNIFLLLNDKMDANLYYIITEAQNRPMRELAIELNISLQKCYRLYNNGLAIAKKIILENE